MVLFQASQHTEAKMYMLSFVAERLPSCFRHGPFHCRCLELTGSWALQRLSENHDTLERTIYTIFILARIEKGPSKTSVSPFSICLI